MIKMRILCFGDSNTYGYDPRSYFGECYPAKVRWVSRLAERTGWDVLNEGQNGRLIPASEYQIRQFCEILEEHKPLDLLIVMLGTNDLLQWGDAKKAASRIQHFVAQIPKDEIKILLAAPPLMKYGQWISEERILTASKQLAPYYKKIAQQAGIYFTDAGCWDVDMAFDGVHFSEKGHKTFAEGIYWEIKKIGTEI